MAASRRFARSVLRRANRITGGSAVSRFTSMVAVSASRAGTAVGFGHGFTTRETIMLARLQLSTKHATWLEDERKIPCEIAAATGVVSKGENLAFEYRKN